MIEAWDFRTNGRLVATSFDFGIDEAERFARLLAREFGTPVAGFLGEVQLVEGFPVDPNAWVAEIERRSS